MTTLLISFTALTTLLAAEDCPAAELCPEEAKEGFVNLFNGKDLTGWQGATDDYTAEGGVLVCKDGARGNLFTEKEYSDFILRLELKLTPGANNGIGIRAPLKGPAHIDGMEIQVLDDEHPKWSKLKPYQCHGGIYGVVAPKLGHLRPAGEWNTQEIYVKGPVIRVTLNGTVITEADLDEVGGETMADHQSHPGLKRKSGYIGFLGHGDRVEFRNLRLKNLSASE